MQQEYYFSDILELPHTISAEVKHSRCLKKNISQIQYDQYLVTIKKIFLMKL